MAKKKNFHTVTKIGSQAEDGKALKRRKTYSHRSGMSNITESPKAGRVGKRIVRSVSNPYKPLALKPEFGGGKDLKSPSKAVSKKASKVATTVKAARKKAKAEKKYARKANSATKKAAKTASKTANKKARVAKKVGKIVKRTARKVNRIGRK